jgi:hypothetical protein
MPECGRAGRTRQERLAYLGEPGIMSRMAHKRVEFESWKSYSRFRRATMRDTRYVHEPDIEAFLTAVRETAKGRVHVLAPGKHLWRAQLGGDDSDSVSPSSEPDPYPPERMKPLPTRAREGRANPKGIPYLYLATKRDTAIAEVRPWIGSWVSVGEFKTLRALRLVNCTKDKQPFRSYRGEPSLEEREESVWRAIGRAFSKPVNPCDDIADYVPMQIIAELFKAAKYDGIQYSSALGDGRNVVLFDLKAAELVARYVFGIENVVITPEEPGTCYPAS